MKNSKTCPKCESTEVVRVVDVGVLQGNTLPGGVGRIPIVRYLCTSCGFSEEWVEGDLELRQLKQRYREES